MAPVVPIGVPGPLPSAVPAQAELSHQLMERADARAGLNPRQAQELRGAACAYLSVVR